MRRSSLVLGTVLLGLAAAPIPQPRASAQCAGPSFEDVDNLMLTRGKTATIEGLPFVDGCQDLGSCSVGCTTECDYGPEPEPSTEIVLRLVQHGRSWRLGVTDADDDGRASWTFEVPRNASPGRATLVADYLSAKVRIR